MYGVRKAASGDLGANHGRATSISGLGAVMTVADAQPAVAAPASARSDRATSKHGSGDLTHETAGRNAGLFMRKQSGIPDSNQRPRTKQLMRYPLIVAVS
jgi:hypothetical protein